MIPEPWVIEDEKRRQRPPPNQQPHVPLPLEEHVPQVEIPQKEDEFVISLV